MPVPGSSSKAIASIKHSPAISSDNVPRAGSVSHQMLPVWLLPQMSQYSTDLKWVKVSQVSLTTLPYRTAQKGLRWKKLCGDVLLKYHFLVSMLWTGLRSTAHPSISLSVKHIYWIEVMLKPHVGEYLWVIFKHVKYFCTFLFIYFPLQLFIF